MKLTKRISEVFGNIYFMLTVVITNFEHAFSAWNPPVKFQIEFQLKIFRVIAF